MKVFFSHPTGNANVRAAAQGLANANLLARFYTTIAAYPGDLAYTIGGINALSEIRRRTYDSSLESITRKWPWKEAARMIASKAGLSGLIKHETGIFSIDAVYKNLDEHVARDLRKNRREDINAVYCYEDGALLTFQAASVKKLACLYDLPIGYWRAKTRILEIEKERWPEWSGTLGGLSDSPEKLLRKDEELSMANLVLVASSFTKKTLDEYPGKLAPVKVIPYGFPPVVASRKYERLQNRKLKLLFVGGLSQRKGIANLFAAVDKLGKHVTLTVVGKKPKINCDVLNKKLGMHTWIPTLSNDKILELMRLQDVFIFPSLFEGFGLVITEAMSQGTPVITTDRTCGADLIKDGENGWIAVAGSTDSLVEKLEECLCRPHDVSCIGQQAIETARQRPWHLYGKELAETLATFNH